MLALQKRKQGKLLYFSCYLPEASVKENEKISQIYCVKLHFHIGSYSLWSMLTY